jgi:hypothetical protein
MAGDLGLVKGAKQLIEPRRHGSPWADGPEKRF